MNNAELLHQVQLEPSMSLEDEEEVALNLLEPVAQITRTTNTLEDPRVSHLTRGHPQPNRRLPAHGVAFLATRKLNAARRDRVNHVRR